MSVTDLLVVVGRYGPAVFFSAVALFYTARIIALRRRLGHSPVAFGRPGTEHHRLSMTFRVFRALIWLVAMARAIWPPVDFLLLPLPGLYTPGVMAGGNLLMVLAFSRVGRLNLQMGRAWRSGIARPAEGAALLTGAPFAHCRHPMLAAVMAGQLGLFLAIPSLFTAICLVLGIGTLLRQAELEEADLARRHGERWTAYAAVTRKWPWSGRLRGVSRRAHA